MISLGGIILCTISGLDKPNNSLVIVTDLLWLLSFIIKYSSTGGISIFELSLSRSYIDNGIGELLCFVPILILSLRVKLKL